MLDTEARRLLWRCRRGMKELDILLERFARAELPHATARQRETLARFLELTDPVLVDYLLGQGIPPDVADTDPELANLVHRIAGRQAATDRPVSNPHAGSRNPAQPSSAQPPTPPGSLP